MATSKNSHRMSATTAIDQILSEYSQWCYLKAIPGSKFTN